MASIFDKFIQKRVINKSVDKIDDTPVERIDTPKGYNTPTITVNKAELHVLANDISELAAAVINETTTLINNIYSSAKDDGVVTYLDTLSKRYSLPSLNDNTPDINIPNTAFKILEREVYRQTNEPKLLLIKDAYRARAEADVIGSVYQNAYIPLLTPSQILNSIESSTFLKGLFFKDQQTLNRLRDKVNFIQNFTIASFEQDFFEGVAEMIHTEKDLGDSKKVVKGIQWGLKVALDSAYDKYSNADKHQESLFGDQYSTLADKTIKAHYVAGFAGLAKTIQQATDGLEYMSSVEPVTELINMRRVIDRSFYGIMGKIEGAYVTNDATTYVNHEADQIIKQNVIDSIKIKRYIAALQPLSNIEISNFPDVSTYFNNLVASSQNSVANLANIPFIPNTKVSQAIILLKEWVGKL